MADAPSPRAIQPAAQSAVRPGRVMRLLDWLSHHHQAAVTGVICLIVGGEVGWLAGSWASCADQDCETPRPDQIEAAGTWAAVIATIGGVLIARISTTVPEAPACSERKSEQAGSSCKQGYFSSAEVALS